MTTSLVSPENKCQWSVSDFCSCNLENLTAVQRHYAIIEALTTLTGKNAINDIATTS